MATTNRGSGLSAPSRDPNYSEHETLLNTSAAPQLGDNSIFPAVNPPPKTSHTRTASGRTNISGTLNQPLNIVVLGASFAGLSVAHAFLDTTLVQLRTTSAAPNYRQILISPSTHITGTSVRHARLSLLASASKTTSSFQSNQAFNATKGARIRSSKVVLSLGTTTLVLSKLSY